MVSLSDLIHAENRYSILGSHFSKPYSTWIIPSLPTQVIYGAGGAVHRGAGLCMAQAV